MPYTPQQARMILDNQFLPGKAMREGIAGREALRQQKQQGQRMEQQMRNDEAKQQMAQREMAMQEELLRLKQEEANEPRILPSGADMVDKDGNVIYSNDVAPSMGSPDALVKLQQTDAYYASQGLPEDHPYRKQISDRIHKLSTFAPKDEDPVIRINMGPEGPSVSIGSDAEEDAARAATEAANTFEDNAKTLSGVTPGSTGLRGAASQLVGGLAGQANEDLGNSVEEAISGQSSQLAEYQRIQQRVFIAKNLRSVIAEQGSRISDTERKIAQDTIRTLEKGASYQQIIGAGAYLLKLQLLAETREAREDGLPYVHDLGSDAGRSALIATLSDAHIDPELVKEIVKEVAKEQGLK